MEIFKEWRQCEMNNNAVLTKATMHAATQLGLTQYQLEQVLGQNQTTTIELDPDSKPGKKALLLIQIFKSLDALNGGDLEWIQYFMCSQNQITGGVPIEQIQNEIGLVKVQKYLQDLLIK